MNLDKDGLASLLARVGEAKGPDRELDVDLAWLLEPQRYAGAYWAARTGKPGTTLPKKLDGLGAIAVQRNCAEFSASIDASLALVERLLSGRLNGPLLYHRRSEWSAHALEADAFTVRLDVAFGDGPGMRLETFEAFGPSEPLATITCLLTALEASNE